ncbi:threonine synthase [Haloferax sp. wsp5]|nr:threonine synthase [Haloferax sp. wsp5]
MRNPGGVRAGTAGLRHAALPDSQPGRFSRTSGVWDFAEFLPTDARASLGEGMTPLVDAAEWEASFKLEYVFPSGSFKDRGATTCSPSRSNSASSACSRTPRATRVAVASYAARAGLDAEIYVPASAKAAKVRRIDRTGADVVRVEGSRQAVTDACVEAVEADDAWYASHAWNPAFFAGTATVAYEIAAQRDWSVPDAVVTPLGHGTLFLGAYRGFRALDRRAGPTLSRAYWERKRSGTVPSPTMTRAGLCRTTLPPTTSPTGPHPGPTTRPADTARYRRDRWCRRRRLRGGNGARTRPARCSRVHVEPTCATATAALPEFRERGELQDGDDVVVAFDRRTIAHQKVDTAKPLVEAAASLRPT